ncbi:MAG: alpha/beta hydrolase [Bacteroides sp.]|nr:alpha/beta hydrolase [Bacteroides sp.]
MKKRNFLLNTLTLFLCLMAGSCSQTKKQTGEQQVDFGKLDIYKAFPSQHFTPRDVLVWTPEEYNKQQKYAVVYMHDGQMLFDKRTSWNKQSWNVDSVACALQKQGKVKPFIVVGINNGPSRPYDYVSKKILDYIPEGDTLLAKHNKELYVADNYLKYLVEEVKPFIDSHYSTLSDKENTIVMGSSLGGVISLYAICEYPDVFGGAGCISTHSSMILENAPQEAPIWAKSLRDYLSDHMPPVNGNKIYMDRGDQTIDAAYIPFQPLIDQQFTEMGWDATHFRTLVFPGAAHDEISWEARLHIPLTFLLGEE